MAESWKPVKGFEKYYLISNTGKVWSIRNKRLRVLVPNYKNGYLTVVLCGENTKKTCTVHRLVAEAFIEKPINYDFVNHKDENKHNNNFSNLEWCTKAYNNTYNGKTQRVCKAVESEDLKTGKKMRWRSAREATKAGYGDYRNISACCTGRKKSAYGKKWRFISWEEAF